jgi:hypothetical protein
MSADLSKGGRCLGLGCLATVSLALLAAGCGSSSKKSTTASTSGTTATTTKAPSTTPTDINGQYTAKLTSQGLTAAGVDIVGVGGGGLWHLSITKKQLVLTPPPPAAGKTKYPVVSFKAGHLTLGPNTECSTSQGKTQQSVFTASESSAGLSFAAVKKACPEDSGALTVAPWSRH